MQLLLQYKNYMTSKEVIQFVGENKWLVTSELAHSFTPSGVSLSEMRARRRAFDARYGAQLFDPESKKFTPYKSGKRRKPYREMGETEIYNSEEEDDDYGEDTQKITPSGIAIVYIKGAITKESFCGAGTDEINALLHELGGNPNVKGVLLYVDSGGGQAAGTETLATTILKYKSRYGKRIEAFVDGCAGSAAYWIISGCDKITLAGETTSVGSIGTMVTIYNYQQGYKLMGIKIDNVYATLSTNKNREYEEAQNGNFEPMRTDALDKINAVFLRGVIQGRYRNNGWKVENFTPEDVPEQLTGKMYFGSEAKAAGLADAIGTFEDVLIAFDSRATNSAQGPQANSESDDIDKIEIEMQPKPTQTQQQTSGLTPRKFL